MNYTYLYRNFYYTFFPMSNSVTITRDGRAILSWERIASSDITLTKRYVKDWCENYIDQYLQTSVEQDYLTEYEEI